MQELSILRKKRRRKKQKHKKKKTQNSAMAALSTACRCPVVSHSSPESYGRPSLAFSSPRPFLGRPVRLSVSRPGSIYFPPQSIRAATTTEESMTTETTVQTEELLADLKAKWDSIENKSTIIVYGGGALVALWLSSTIVGAVNSVPLLPKILELVGLGYTGWFVYRYLLFKERRKELISDVEELKAKITGTGKDL